MAVASKVLNAHLKTIRGIMVKGFAKVDTRLDALDKKVDDVRIELKSDIEKVQLSLEDTIGKVSALGGNIERVQMSLEKTIGKVGAVGDDLESLAAMTAREFKAVRSEIAHKNLLLEA